MSRRLWHAGLRWSQCDCVDLSAAFAYFTLQSIFPLLLIALAVAAKVFGSTSGMDQVIDAITPLLPPSAVGVVESTLLGLVAQGFGAGLFGVALLVLAASNAYLTLQRGADRLWEEFLPQTTTVVPLKTQAIDFVRGRLEAFLIVVLAASLIVLEQIVFNLGRIPESLMASLLSMWPDAVVVLKTIPFLNVGHVIVPTLWLSLLSLLLQRVLPSRRVPWKQLIPGALLVGEALNVLNSAFSLSIISLGNRFQAYGVIGGVMVLTLWVWLIGVIHYFGQCLSVELASARSTRL